MTGILAIQDHFANENNPLEEAFERRNLFPWLQRSMRPVADPQECYSRLIAKKQSGKAVVYIHVPFCANHCLFCGFYRDRSVEDEMREYCDHLVHEIETDPVEKRLNTVHAVYFGGGTPSALCASDLQRIIRALRDNLPLAPDCEITVEGRVAGFDLEKVDACFDVGVNRISVGVQAFDTQLRRRFGRKADRDGVVSFLSALSARDKAAVVCDLIFGLPGQTMQGWQEDVRLCSQLGLDGVDLYCLTVHDKGPLAMSIKKGALPAQSPLSEMARMYKAGLKIIEQAGWRHLNQAHWAANTRERNLYNQLVKGGADCIAYGSGAGGLLDGQRYVVDGDRHSYQQRIAKGEKPVAMILPAARHHHARDFIMGSLEGGRLDLDKLEKYTAPGLRQALYPLFEQWQHAGLLNLCDGVAVLRTPGWFWHCNLVGSLFELVGEFMDGNEAEKIRFDYAEKGKKYA